VALNPNNPINWEILGSIYRQISGVAQNALSFSLDSYGRAITRDPLNPVLRLTVGGIYFSINNYDMAIRFFTDAVNLKPDYANANFNLAIALAQKGDFVSAQTIAERTVSLLDPKSEDYKIATQVLSQIKDKVASQAADQAKLAEQQAEATSQQSSLQDKNLPKVLNLPAPENVSTPAAIKKQTPK
jgi:cytochrome c-type biogenesis protein CcmH/NrfG